MPRSRSTRSGAPAARAARPSRAEAAAPPVPDASSPELLDALRGADLGARARAITRLQQERGNARVQRLVKGARPKGDGGGAKVKPDATALLQAQYGNLARILEPQHVARLQKALDSLFEIQKLDEKLAELEAPEIKYLHATSLKRERIHARQEPYWRVFLANNRIAVPTSQLLADDVLAPDGDRQAAMNARDKKQAPERPPDTKHSPAAMAFRERIYKQVIQTPHMLEVRGREKIGPPLKLSWGREEWVNDGPLDWLYLMRWNQRWNLEYQSILLGELVEVASEMARLRREMGGIPHTLYGKKLGETWGYVYNSDVEVGQELGKVQGYWDDADGKMELYTHMYRAARAQIVVKAPDGWLHLYALKPNIKAWIHLTKPVGRGQDGWVYLLNEGCEVPGQIVEIVTGDVRTLEPSDIGWRAREDPNQMGSFAQFAVGAIFGDFFEEESGAATIGSILMGLVPIVGQIADARDVAAGVLKMYETGGKEGKLQTALALIGFVPFFGDVIKSSRKGGKQVMKEAVTRSAPEIRDRLAKGIVDDPAGAAKHFGVADVAAAAGKEMSEGAQAVAKAVGDAKAAEAIAKEVDDLLKSGASPAFVVQRFGGDWAKLAKALDATDAGKAAGKTLDDWRRLQIEELKAAAGGAEIVPTGSKGLTSDIDVSIAGKNASATQGWAIRFLEQKYGLPWADVRKLLDLGIFTESKRLHMFTEIAEELGGKGLRKEIGTTTIKKLHKQLVAESEINVLAKMLREGASEATVKRHAKNMGVGWDAVSRRAKEIDELASSAAKRRAAELEMDVLHARFEALKEAKQFKEAADVSKEMSILQGKLNTLVEDAYVTAGGVFKNVPMRELEKTLLSAKDEAAKAAAQKEIQQAVKAMTPEMRYMAFLDESQMLSHVSLKLRAAGNVFTLETAKTLTKYTERLMSVSAKVGVTGAGARQARELAERVVGLFAEIKKAPAASLPRFTQELEKVRGLLESQFDELLVGARRSSGKYAFELISMEREVFRDAALLWRQLVVKGEDEGDSTAASTTSAP